MNLVLKRHPMAIYYIRNQMTVQRCIIPDRRSSVDSLVSPTQKKMFQRQHHDLCDDFDTGFEEERETRLYDREKRYDKCARRNSEGQFSDSGEYFQSDLPDDFVPVFEEGVPGSYEQSIPIEHFTMNSQ